VQDQHLHLRRRQAARLPPGFGSPYYPELNIDGTVLRNLHKHLEALRDGTGPDVGLLLDLNFNAKTEGFLKILRAIADIDMLWVEIDSYSPQALGYIRRPQPASDRVVRDAAHLREFLPTSASRRWMSRSSTRRGTACGSR
jgi:hypothetical protein